jgi:hypothetical protein
MLDRVRHLRYNVRVDNTQPTERIDTMLKDRVHDKDTMEVMATCRFCGTTHTITVYIDDYFDWQEGELIQRAMPYLTPGERELLKSQTCQDCWDKMMAGLPDEEEEEVFVSDEDGFITLSELDIDDFIEKFF